MNKLNKLERRQFLAGLIGAAVTAGLPLPAGMEAARNQTVAVATEPQGKQWVMVSRWLISWQDGVARAEKVENFNPPIPVKNAWSDQPVTTAL